MGYSPNDCLNRITVLFDTSLILELCKSID
jgi:hypothetical protein